MIHKIEISWGFIIEAIILGFFLGIGIESCGRYIGKGISEIKITVMTVREDMATDAIENCRAIAEEGGEK